MTSTNGNGFRRPFDTERKSNFTMQLIKLAACILVLVTKISSAGSIIETSNVNESSLIEAVINIVESCYTDRFSTVGLAGSSAGRIMTKMSLRDTPIPVAMVEMPTREKKIDRRSRYKLQVFVITTNIGEHANFRGLYDFRRTLKRVGASKWWNHMASFIFTDLTASENGCSTAAKVLFEAWSINLLNSKFVCVHQTRGRLIYTFNPYTNKAPNPWHQEDIREGINGHPWTLFAREYREDESDCYELDFDKTVDVGGHEIHAVGPELLNLLCRDCNVRSNLSDRRRNVTAELLMSSLNATWKVVPRLGEANFRLELDVFHDLYDISLTHACYKGLPDADYTDIINESQVYFVTQYPGHKSQIYKIISVLDRRTRFSVFVVFIITLLFLKFWLRKTLTASILDLVLLVSNAALRRMPQETAPRIYLASLFIFVVTIQGIYSGKFASLLTKDVRLKTVDTVEDLTRSNYTIYGALTRIMFCNVAFKGRFDKVNVQRCTEDVVRDPKAACIYEDFVAFEHAATNKLHLSKKSLGSFYVAYAVRPNWPLVERVNEIFRRANAGGLLETRYSIQRDSLIRSIESYEKHDQEPKVKILTLKQLRFAFVFLGIGLGCAAITLIIEGAIFGIPIAIRRNRILR